MSDESPIDALLKNTVEGARVITSSLDRLLKKNYSHYPMPKDMVDTIKTVMTISANLNLRLSEENDALRAQNALLLKKSQG